MYVWWYDRDRDDITVSYTYSSTEEAQKVLDYINEFTVKDEEPTFTFGEEVLVRDYDEDIWVTRLYICTILQAKYSYICVDDDDRPKFIKWEKVTNNFWKQIKKLPKEEKKEEKVVTDEDGKKYKLVPIS